MKSSQSNFKKVKNARTPEQYYAYFEKIVAESPDPEADSETRERQEYTKLNLQRSARIARTYNISPNLRQALESINQPQTWVVITEAWCGDSAQNLPCIEKMAAVNPNISLRVLLRDEHPEIMDLYLTNGARSIPVVVAIDDSGNEIFRWGPRPKEAAELISSLKKQGYEKLQFLEQLHLWYGRNRGKALEKEFLHLIS